jgi:Flp pilus assembly protein TadG
MRARVLAFLTRVWRASGDRAGQEGGQVLVLAALAMAVLLGAAALSVDVGAAAAQKRAAQAAVDAAALAGASDLPGVTQDNTQAKTDANSTLTSNLTHSGLTNVTTTVNSPPSASATTSPACPGSTSHGGDTASVQVCLQATVPSFFLGVLNVGATQLKVHAVATGSGALGTPPVAVLDPSANDSLDIGEDSGSGLTSEFQPSGGVATDCNGGAGSTYTINGPVYTNSTAYDAEEVHADCTLVTTATNHIAGSDNLVCDDTCGTFSPAPTQGDGSQLPDPLGYLSPPASVTSAGSIVSDPTGKCSAGPPPSCIVSNGSSVTVDPGVWNNLEVTGSGKLTMNPGTYVITGSVQLTGTQGASNTGTASGTLTGSGVMMYFTCPSSSSPYWANCASGGGTSGQTGNASCPNDCSAASDTSGCPNECSPGGFLNLQTIGGNGKFTLSAPTSGTYQGLLAFFDRNNYVPRPGANENQETFNLEIIPNSSDSMSGTLYAERSNAWIVTKTANFSENSCIIVNSIGIYGPKNFTLSCTPAANAIPSNIPYGGASLTE